MTKVNAPSDLPHALHAFLTAFYRASDTSPHGNASANALYADFFCADAPLLMGDKTFTGREEYVKFREAGWEKVASREHVVLDVFPKEKEGNGDAELMLRGTVAYGMKDGSNGSADWAGHMKLRWLEDEGGYKLAFYQVWIVSRENRLWALLWADEEGK
jgi:prepilin-type processing-associated H-X9-DG protein